MAIKPENIVQHASNERTFLAWIRTSISLIMFGFVVEKFSFSIRQLSFVVRSGHPVQSPNHYIGQLVTGVVLIGLGAVISVLAFLKYLWVAKQIEKNDFQHSTFLDLLVTLIIFFSAILLLIYLIRSF